MKRVRGRGALACAAAFGLAAVGLAFCGRGQGTDTPGVGTGERSLEVTASAYNSVVAQTNARPDLGAWGDRLRPGMKAIAVSRDLIALGLGHGAVVQIDGLPGEYRVLDKMARRWKHKIDIYMGNDVAAAREWGVRTVTIRWRPDSAAAAPR